MKRYIVYCLFALVFIFPWLAQSQDEPVQILAEQKLGPGKVMDIFKTAEKESDYYDCLSREDEIASTENPDGKLYWLKDPPDLDEALANNNFSAAENPIGQLKIISAVITRPNIVYEGDIIEVQFEVCNTNYDYWSEETTIDVYVSEDHDFDSYDDWYAGSVYLREIEPAKSAYSGILAFYLPYGCNYSVKIAAILDGIMYLSSNTLWINCRPSRHIYHNSRSGGCFIISAAK